ncbi:MAG: hypothetical protein WAX07_02185 [Candidatus Altiarchaeia archaeon]
MTENLLCTIIGNGWIAFAVIFLLLTLYQIIRYKRETDLLEKDMIGDRIKYPLIALVIAIVSSPLWGLIIQEGLLPVECDGTGQVNTSEHVITEFSDGETRMNISFMLDGGFNSDVRLEIPRNARITKTVLELEHPPEETWTDEFYDLNKTYLHDSIDVNETEHYAFINIRKLVVDRVVTLEGTNVFDDVVIKRGGTLETGSSKRLNLIVRGTLWVEPGASISADGKNDVKDPDYTKRGTNTLSQASGGGGGAYGGDGGKGGDDGYLIGGEGALSFGSKTEPGEIGLTGAHGGGAQGYDGSGLPGTGGRGGGALRIDANKIVLEGTISSNGANGVDSLESEGSAGGGGGSGGSIRIIAGTFIFNGELNANGGKGGDKRQKTESSISNAGGGGGGGGRISITYDKKSGEGTVSAKGGEGGKSAKSSMSGQPGKEGTLYGEAKEIQGMSLINVNITSVVIHPDNLVSWKKFYANATTPLGSSVKFAVLNSLDNTTLCEISPEEALEGYDITECVGNAWAIIIRAELITLSFQRTPRLYYWKVAYDTHILDLEMDMGIDQISEYSNPAATGRIILSDNNTRPGISDEISRVSRECGCRGCMPSEEGCNITIRFQTKSSGFLIVENPRLEYIIP